MPTALVTLRPDGLIHRLRDLGVLTPQQIEQARQELVNTQERFSAILVRQGWLRDPDIGKRLAAQLGAVPQLVDAPAAIPSAAARVPKGIWRSHRLAPVSEQDGRLLLATDDPLSVFALELFGRLCDAPVDAVFVREQDLAAMWERLGSAPAPNAVEGPTPSPAEGTVPPAPTRPSPSPAAPRPDAKTERADRPQPAGGADDEPIIRLVDSMFSEAVRMRGSDIHVEPDKDQVRIRYRIDGVLHDVNTAPRPLHGPIVSRIKILGGLNIAEKRLPQDGRLQLAVENRPLDIRISTLPAMHGESIVMRLLDRSQPFRGLAEMGMLPQDQEVWHTLIRRPHGMILVTGPTGSGKTTTLYGALALLNQPDRKLITVEDPVEYQLSGVNQVQVKAGIGMTFAAGLRAMLRQAPDVIMVGEIRDQETAQVAVQAALTGHLVLSTLHTNDAPSAVTRLIDMGIPPFLVASTVQGVLAQRLIRRICHACRITDNATPEERAFLGEPEVAQVIRSNGCETCHGSGFYGRVGIFELLVVTERLRQLIVAKTNASALRAAAAREGMRGMREDGIGKIREGATTLTELLRVVAGSEE